MKNLKSTAIAKVNSRAYHKNLIRLALMFCMATMIFCNNVICAYANAENAKPTGAGGATTMSTMVNIVFWIVRVIIVAFAIPGIIKIVQGQSDENPRDRNAGIATVITCGACFAGSFAVAALI